MARVQAISIGHALDVDCAGFGAVHSVFDRAVNLSMARTCGLCWVMIKQTFRSDFVWRCRISARLVCAGGLGQRASGPRGHRLAFVVDCRAALRWIPAGADKSGLGFERRLAYVATAAVARSWHESAPMARAVRAAMSRETGLGDVLAKVVGRGPGATPAGDDVLVGVLAVLTSPRSGRSGAEAAASLCRALIPLLPTTTEVSGQLLRQASRGLLGRDIHELASALQGAPSRRQLNEKVHQVIEAGATSGADTCEGLL